MNNRLQKMQYFEPVMEKNGEGGERVKFNLRGSAWGYEIDDSELGRVGLDKLQSDKVRLWMFDVQGSNLAPAWKIAGECSEYVVRDFERQGLQNAIVMATKEARDAL